MTHFFVLLLLLTIIFTLTFTRGAPWDNDGDLNSDFHQELSLLWEDIDLQHLSSVTDSHLHSNGFHVINASFPSDDSSYVLHISKTQDLYHPVKLTNQRPDHLDCFYSGTVTKVSNGVSSKQGVVSLSSCHHNIGFEGLVLLPNEQYYIRPSAPAYKAKRSTSSSKPNIPHKVFKVSSTNPETGLESLGNVDVILRAPAEDLRKASDKQFQNDEDDEDERVEDLPTKVEESEENDMDLGRVLMDNNEDSFPPLMEALSAGNKKVGKKPPKKGASTSGKSQVVEIAVFTDEKLYKAWKKLYPKGTMDKIDQYILAVINNMNALYKQPSMPEPINFRLVHMEVLTNKPKGLKDHNSHATKYLKSFCEYSAEKNPGGRLWDHSLLLTGHDLQEGGSTATAGIAWFSTMCINGYSCSLIEGSTFGSTFITAHEIGHSLGMEHDGSGPNAGCNADSYIMSPTTGGGKTDWSTCSVKNLRDFIGDGYLGNPAPKCITKKGSKAGDAIKFSSNKLPGQQFSADEQCEAECKGCTPHTTGSPPYNNMCHLLFCKENKGIYSIVRSTHPALEGTGCGKGKVCRIGKCQ